MTRPLFRTIKVKDTTVPGGRMLALQEAGPVRWSSAVASDPTHPRAVLFREIIEPGGVRARNKVREWRTRNGASQAGIERWLGENRHAMLERLTLADVVRVTRSPDRNVRTDHPLLDPSQSTDRYMHLIRSTDIGAGAFKNMNVPWSMHMLLHRLLEEKGALFRFEEFDRQLKGPWRDIYWEPATSSIKGDLSAAQIEVGYRYRVGLAYYDFLRELDLYVRLRDMGLPIRYNVFADVVFGIDFWCGRTLIGVFVQNEEFRTMSGGRKASIDAHVDPGVFLVDYLPKEAASGNERGVCSLFRPEAIDGLAARLRAHIT